MNLVNADTNFCAEAKFAAISKSRRRVPVNCGGIFKKIALKLGEKKVEMRADPESFGQLSALNYRPLHRACHEDCNRPFLNDWTCNRNKAMVEP